MKKVLLFFFIFIPCLFMTSGCWNRRELNELALVVALAIDKSGDKYQLSAQVVDPGEVASKKGGGGRTPVTTYTDAGDNIFETIRRMTTEAPRKLYFSHLQMLVISEDIAKEGISESLEIFARDPEFRKDFYIVIAKDTKGKDVLENLTTIEKIPANKMHSSLEASEKSWAPTVAVQLDELLADLTSPGKQAVLTGISIKGNKAKGESKENVERIQPFARLQYKNIAVFKKDQMIGWLNEVESKGYNYITDNVKNTVGDIPCPKKGELVVETVRSKSKVTGKVVNGEPKIDIQISGECNVGEVYCDVDLTKPETIKQLEKSVNKVNTAILTKSVKKAKELGVDIYGFGDVIHRANPQAWKLLEKDWSQHFVDMPITIHSDFKIRRTGVTNQSYIKEVKGE
ncbi:Ger(x)C family spore germination protein [Bacillus sp. 1NLA3E]|uniref:Ger(x)C family spore germination protein n=1 Tax=Bacillus sp. 1NLA3E TaxID=666686 RepID=UPI000247EAD1|nr:Ger(x)C family spore germination protein [Bacillus sp. 1NLA3E]AGK53406.1 Ger(x)C family germination protein [Bacillus sp. 1NLA3E]